MDSETQLQAKYDILDFLINHAKEESDNYKRMTNELHNALISLESMICRLENVFDVKRDLERNKVLLEFYKEMSLQ